jgi:hypothetical protein
VRCWSDWRDALRRVLIRFQSGWRFLDGAAPHDVAAGASEPIEQKSIIARFTLGERRDGKVNKTALGFLVYLSTRSLMVDIFNSHTTCSRSQRVSHPRQ